MGLDMYAYAIDEKPAAEVDFKAKPSRAVHYWRKHPDLHGWMRNLYYAKGGTDEQFNCVNVMLTREDIDALEAAIKAGELPPTSGFFFGASDGSEQEDDLAFITKAREVLGVELFLFYTSWW